MKPRIIETSDGIQDELDVKMYDKMQRNLRDKGYIETKDIIKRGISRGMPLK